MHGQDLGELYDRDRDPDETHNSWLRRLCDCVAGGADLPPARRADW